MCYLNNYSERRRLKKLRKDRLKQLATGSSIDSANNDLEKKHKHKHKCSDEFCKHRKHKKRRKHKKHSHRDAGTPTTDHIGNGNTNEPIAIVDDDEDDDDADTERTDNSDNAQNGFPVPVEEKSSVPANPFVTEMKEETLTEDDVASSITEDSSGSSYVSVYYKFC